jgi:hypothetical protein
MKLRLSLVFALMALFLVSECHAATYHLPPNTTISNGQKVHFGNYWISTSGTDIHIMVWFVDNWLNYTVDSGGTQQIYNGSKPTSIFLDDVNKTEGDGWSYSGTTVTVTGAATSASLYWGSGGTPSVTVTITSPTNTTYTSSSVPVQLSASGGTIDTILWNCTFTNGTVVYANTVYTTVTSMTLGNGTYIFNAYANNTDGNWDEGTVTFTVEISSSSSSTIGYQLGQGAVAAAGMLGIVMLLGMAYVALEGKDTKYAVMLAAGEVLLLVTMLVLSQLSILG